MHRIAADRLQRLFRRPRHDDSISGPLDGALLQRRRRGVVFDDQDA